MEMTSTQERPECQELRVRAAVAVDRAKIARARSAWGFSRRNQVLGVVCEFFLRHQQADGTVLIRRQ
jgi:hypothetical protein